MREMVFVVVSFAVVTLIGTSAICVVDAILDIHHVNADGVAVRWTVSAIHHLPYFFIGGALVAMHRTIFGR